MIQGQNGVKLTQIEQYNAVFERNMKRIERARRRDTFIGELMMVGIIVAVVFVLVCAVMGLCYALGWYQPVGGH